jgi:hypothetical protein
MQEQTQQHSKSKPLRIVLYAMALLLIVILGLACFLWANKQELKQQLLAQINKSLHTQITIQRIGIDFYHNFPQIGLDLQDVKVTDAFNTPQELLAAGHIYIGFNIWDILNKNYRIRKLNIDSGSVHLLITKTGKANYMIHKADSTSKNETFIYLESVTLKNMLAVYDDRNHKQYDKALINQMNCELKAEENQFQLICKGNMDAHELRSGKIAWIKDKEITVDLGFNYMYSKSELVFKNSSIQIEKLPLHLIGKINNQNTYTDIDIGFKASQTNIQSLLGLVPFKLKLTEEWKSEGVTYFEGSIKGKLSDKKNPDVHIAFSVENGRLNNEQKNIALNHVACNGIFKYSNGDGLLQLQPFSFKMSKSDFNGSLKLTSFNDLMVEASVNCHAEGTDLIKLTGKEILKNADGYVDANLSCRGRYKDLTNNAAKAESAGQIRIALKNLSFQNREENIEKLDAELQLNGTNLLIKRLQATLYQSDVEISGELKQVYAYLFDKKELMANIEYHSGYIDLAKFYVPTASASKPLTFPQRIRLKADIKIDELDYNLFKAKQIVAGLIWEDAHITVNDISVQTMNGNIKGNLQVFSAADGRLMLSTKTNLSEVNITEVFRQCNNFSQTEIVDKNLKGLLNCEAEIISVWSQSGACDLDKLYVLADVELKNGEIIHYEPLQKLSRFANVDDLRNLKFASLRNKIEIRDQTIFIPEMEILSNAMNITLAGSHTFNNYLDYRLKIKLSELLKKKRKPSENEFGEEDENGKGLSLFLTMKGPVNDLNIAYDKIGVKEKIKQDLHKEKENITDVLKKELGIGKDTEIKEKQTNSDELEFEPE